MTRTAIPILGRVGLVVRVREWRDHMPASSAMSTFSSLRVRNYRLFFTGQTISVAGNWMQNVAIGWLALELTHSGTWLGIVTAARFVPLVLFGPVGGLVADRIDNRRLVTSTQTVLAGLSLLLAVLTRIGVVTLPVLLAVVLALGMVSVVDGPARQSLISELVDRRHLANAIALNSVTVNLARVLGPGLGGALIVAVGVTPCFFVNTLTFGAVIVSLGLIRRRDLVPAQREALGKGQVMAGLRYVRDVPELKRVLVMVTVTGILTWEFPVTLPLVTTLTFHQSAQAYGLALACLGAGSICGGLVAARRTRHAVRTLAVSATLWGAEIVLASFAPTLLVEYAFLVLVGAGAVTFSSSAKTLLQLASVPSMRGRVMALWSMAWKGGTVVGGPLVGLLAAVLGARLALLAGGLAALAVGGASLLALSRAAPGTGRVTAAESPPQLDEAPTGGE